MPQKGQFTAGLYQTILFLVRCTECEGLDKDERGCSLCSNT